MLIFATVSEEILIITYKNRKKIKHPSFGGSPRVGKNTSHPSRVLPFRRDYRPQRTSQSYRSRPAKTAIEYPLKSYFGHVPEAHDFAQPQLPAPRGRAVRYISWGEPRPKRMPLPSLMQGKLAVISAQKAVSNGVKFCKNISENFYKFCRKMDIFGIT